ncbi:MAG TPA: aldo/keto reductase [Chromatiaceae bacterium]|jgi:diketogulonate reductase-like aldo/keto reductase|nr:MAG: aldo/keto reductase [Thiohalocapsa sp. PB-PSB1]HBG94145.1 aldo/keto reductase [Chromatiaceae bacterium]HCS90933.1 aldo/keto reductase [Chromatiaceae bacterium]
MVDQEWLITAAGVKMPRLIYGTAWKKERTADLVVKAIQSGFKGIDTACQPKHYDERLVGAALRRLKDQGVERDNLFLQTKFTALADQDPRQVPYDKNSPIESQVIQSFEASKNNLQTQYLDSLVLHSPLEPHGLLMRVWDAMETIQKTGGALQLGISNCYNTEVIKQLYDDATIKPAVVQNRFYKETGYDADLRNWCANHGVIYQSFWTLTANPHILTSNTVQTIAQKYNRTAPQIFFRYLSQIGIVPLTGTCSEQHMKEDLSIFDFELSSDDLNYVSRIFKQA